MQKNKGPGMSEDERKRGTVGENLKDKLEGNMDA